MKNFKPISALLFCLFTGFYSSAQVRDSSINGQLFSADSVYKTDTFINNIKPRLRFHSFAPAFDFDQRFYYTQKRWSNVWGYREGLIVNEKWKVGIGEYYSNESANSNVIIPKRLISKGLKIQNTLHFQQLYLGNLYFEPFLIRRTYYELSLVFETGYGKTVNNYEDKVTQKTYNGHSHYIVPAGEGFSFNLKFPALPRFGALRWFGINAVGGYREALAQGDRLYSYNGYYWSISSAIFLDRMLIDYKHWRKERKSNAN